MLRITTGIKLEVRGLENVPTGSAIIASKHQSAFETIAFHAILHNAIYILKRSLFLIPPVGWCMWKSGCIGIDRKAGASALRYMTKEAIKKLNEDKKLIIFPEGTRTPVGSNKPYQPGIAMIYAKSNAPVIPVALNSGMFWERNAFAKKKGTVIIEFLPPIAPGLSKKEFLKTLKDTIETASNKLCNP
ncbi:MAG: 1-acyl-sn-glycerol-3-phosphate acyltransferase [Alphaproteobacteria bacterium]|nr:1-acyl-sn-glycerol-3-phosphate acyltransferase [Alphaproteobacteria bacterium]